jgi:hypothetical protein
MTAKVSPEIGFVPSASVRRQLRQGWGIGDFPEIGFVPSTSVHFQLRKAGDRGFPPKLGSFRLPAFAVSCGKAGVH